MTFRKSTLLLIALAAFAALVGCSSNSTPFSLTMNQFPTSVFVNSLTPIAANATTGGVTWSCTAPNNATCGTFSSTTTTSGVATNYLAPPFPVTGVVVTATSNSNPSSVVSTPAFTVTAATLAAGATYVYSLSGFDTNGLYSVAGAFTVGANGTTITGGEQDFVDSAVAGTTDGINPTGSSIALSADNNLTITLVICSGNAVPCTGIDSSLPSGGTEVLTGTVIPDSGNGKVLITEFDSSATSSGELDGQTAPAVPAGGYAFQLNGYDSDGAWVAIGGIINVDDLPLTVGGPATVGTISGTGSEYDVNDADDDLILQGQTITTGSGVTTPDSFGRVTFTLNNPEFGTFVIAGYVIDSTRIRLVENFTDGFGGTTGGTALSQATADVGLFSATNVSGNTYVVGLNGLDPFFALQTAGQFTLNADNSVGGFINYNDTIGAGIVAPATSQAPSPITGGTWAIDAAGTVSLTGITDGIDTFNLQLYVDGNGNLLSISLDETDVLSGRGWQQSGTGAFAATSFTGAYAMGATGWEPDDGLEFDAVGEVVADGVGTFTGFADYNWFDSTGPTYPDQSVTGTFTAASSGVFTGTITGLDADNCSAYGVGEGCTNDAFSFYLIDATGDNIAIETDTTQVTLGYFTQK